MRADQGTQNVIDKYNKWLSNGQKNKLKKQAQQLSMQNAKTRSGIQTQAMQGLRQTNDYLSSMGLASNLRQTPSSGVDWEYRRMPEFHQQLQGLRAQEQGQLDAFGMKEANKTIAARKKAAEEAARRARRRTSGYTVIDPETGKAAIDQTTGKAKVFSSKDEAAKLQGTFNEDYRKEYNVDSTAEIKAITSGGNAPKAGSYEYAQLKAGALNVAYNDPVAKAERTVSVDAFGRMADTGAFGQAGVNKDFNTLDTRTKLGAMILAGMVKERESAEMLRVIDEYAAETEKAKNGGHVPGPEITQQMKDVEKMLGECYKQNVEQQTANMLAAYVDAGEMDHVTAAGIERLIHATPAEQIDGYMNRVENFLKVREMHRTMDKMKLNADNMNLFGGLADDPEQYDAFMDLASVQKAWEEGVINANEAKEYKQLLLANESGSAQYREAAIRIDSEIGQRYIAKYNADTVAWTKGIINDAMEAGVIDTVLGEQLTDIIATESEDRLQERAGGIYDFLTIKYDQYAAEEEAKRPAAAAKLVGMLRDQGILGADTAESWIRGLEEGTLDAKVIGGKCEEAYRGATKRDAEQILKVAMEEGLYTEEESAAVLEAMDKEQMDTLGTRLNALVGDVNARAQKQFEREGRNGLITALGKGESFADFVEHTYRISEEIYETYSAMSAEDLEKRKAAAEEIIRLQEEMEQPNPSDLNRADAAKEELREIEAVEEVDEMIGYYQKGDPYYRTNFGMDKATFEHLYAMDEDTLAMVREADERTVAAYREEAATARQTGLDMHGIAEESQWRLIEQYGGEIYDKYVVGDFEGALETYDAYEKRVAEIEGNWRLANDRYDELQEKKAWLKEHEELGNEETVKLIRAARGENGGYRISDEGMRDLEAKEQEIRNIDRILEWKEEEAAARVTAEKQAEHDATVAKWGNYYSADRYDRPTLSIEADRLQQSEDRLTGKLRGLYQRKESGNFTEQDGKQAEYYEAAIETIRCQREAVEQSLVNLTTSTAEQWLKAQTKPDFTQMCAEGLRLARGSGDELTALLRDGEAAGGISLLQYVDTGAFDLAKQAETAALMNDAERQTYFYYLAKGGEKLAKEYYDAMVPMMNRRRMENLEEICNAEWTGSAVIDGIVKSGLKVLTAPTAWMEEIGVLGMNLAGHCIDPDDPIFTMSAFRGGLQGSVRNSIYTGIMGDSEEWKSDYSRRARWASVCAFAYDTTISVAENWLMRTVSMGLAGGNAEIGEIFNLSMMSLSSAEETQRKYLQMGASATQAAEMGFFAGVCEALFEKVSLENIINMPKMQLNGWLMNTLTQAGIEASEEGCTELANIFCNVLVMGSRNDYNRAVEEKIRSGKSEAAARSEAFIEQIEDIGLAMAGGGLSGAMMGGFESWTSMRRIASVGGEIRYSNAGLDTLLAEARAVPDGKVQQLLAKTMAAIDSKASLRNIDIGMLNYAVQISGLEGVNATIDTMVSEGEIGRKEAKQIKDAYEREAMNAGMGGYVDETIWQGVDEASVGKVTARLMAEKKLSGEGMKTFFRNKTTEAKVIAKRKPTTEATESMETEAETMPDLRPIQPSRTSRTTQLRETTVDETQAAEPVMQNAKRVYEDADGGIRLVLHEGTNANSLNRAQVRKMNFSKVVAAATGLEIVVHDTLGNANGFYRAADGTLHIGLDAASFTGTMAHELTHFIKAQAAESWAGFAEEMKKLAGEKNWQRLIGKKAEQYAEEMNATKLEDSARTAYVEEEAIASLCEDMLNDRGRFYEFCKDMPELAQKLAAVLDRVIRTFKEMVDGRHGKNTWMLGNDVEELEAIRDSWYRLLKEASDAQKAGIAGEESMAEAAQFQIKEETDKNGKKIKYVKADGMVLEGDNPARWETQVENHINSLLNQDGYAEITTDNGEKIIITGRGFDDFNTIGKVSSSSEFEDENGRLINKEGYRAKEYAALYIEEIIQVSGLDVEKDNHKIKHNAHAERGWQYRTAYFEDEKENYYKITLSVAKSRKGNAAYNIRTDERSNPNKFSGSSVSGALNGVASGTNDTTELGSVKPFDMKQLKERDEAYQSAVESGDTEAQRNLVKLAASIAGYIPVTRYHQTGERFTEFSTDNPVAGQYDSATPNGIFLKDNDHDIGVGGDYVNTGHGGDIQMELYIKADNMLRFGNRDSATRWYKENIPGYGELYDEMKAKIGEIDAEVEALEDKYYYEDAISEDEFEQKWDELVHGKMKPLEDGYRSQLRELLNDFFLAGKSGYDGIELIYDGSRYIDGKKESVHTYIVFNANQVKSADPVTYDDNGNVIPLSQRFDIENNDIRYDLKDTDEQKSFGYSSRYLRDELYDLWGYRQRPSDYTYEQYYEEHLNEWQSKSRVRDNKTLIDDIEKEYGSIEEYAKHLAERDVRENEETIRKWIPYEARANELLEEGLSEREAAEQAYSEVIEGKPKASHVTVSETEAEATPSVTTSRDTSITEGSETTAKAGADETTAETGTGYRSAEERREETEAETGTGYRSAEERREETEAELEAGRAEQLRSGMTEQQPMTDLDAAKKLAAPVEGIDPETEAKTKVASDTIKTIAEGVKNVLNFGLKDPARMLDALAGKAKDVRHALSELIERPFNEAGRRYAQGYRDRSTQFLDRMQELGIIQEQKGSLSERKAIRAENKRRAAAIMWYGEGKKRTVDGQDFGAQEARPYTLDNLKEDFPNDWQNIVKATELVRNMYDDYADEINAMLEKVYPNVIEHAETRADKLQLYVDMEQRKADNQRAYIGELEATVKTLEQQIDLAEGREATGQIGGAMDEQIARYEKRIAELREELKTHRDGTKAKARTEKSIAFNEERLRAAQEFKKQSEARLEEIQGRNKGTELKKLKNALAYAQQRLETATEMLEAYEAKRDMRRVQKQEILDGLLTGDGVRNRRILKRSDYFHHYQEQAEGIARLMQIIRGDSEISPELVGKTDQTNPKSKWTGFMQRRRGDKTEEDAVTGMLLYMRDAERKLAFDPFTEHLNNVKEQIQNAASERGDRAEAHNANDMLRWMDEWRNQILGKSNRIDRAVFDNGLGSRKLRDIVGWINGRAKSNAILGNFHSAAVQVSNIANAATYVTNPKDWFSGARLFWQMKHGTGEAAEAVRAAYAKSGFMTQRYGIEQQDYNEHWTPKQFALQMMGWGDEAAGKLMWLSAYSQYARNPMSSQQNAGVDYRSAVEYADDITRRSTAGRGIGEQPVSMNSKLLNLIAPFQLEVNNQYQNFKEQFGKRNAAGLIELEVITYLMNGMFEALMGDRPLGFDLIAAVVSAIKEGSAPDEEDDEEKPLAEKIGKSALYSLRNTAGTVIGGMPFAGQISGAFGELAGENVLGDYAPNLYGTDVLGFGTVGDAVLGGIKFAKNAVPTAKNGGAGALWELFLQNSDFLKIAPEWGGAQLQRTLKGVDAAARGYSEKINDEGQEEAQFAIDQSVGNIARAAMFGKWATPEGKAFLDGETKGLNAEKTAEMKQMKERYGISASDYFDVFLTINAKAADGKPPKTNVKAERLAEMDIPTEQKIELSGLVSEGFENTLKKLKRKGASDTLIDLAIRKYGGYAALDSDKNAGNTDPSGQGAKFRAALVEDKMTSNEDKNTIYQTFTGSTKELDFSNAFALTLSEKSEKVYARSREAAETGISDKDLLIAYQKYNDAEGKEGKTSKRDMQAYIMKKDYTPEQKAAMDRFLFGTAEDYEPADYTNEETFTATTEYPTQGSYVATYSSKGKQDEALRLSKLGIPVDTYIKYDKMKGEDGKNANKAETLEALHADKSLTKDQMLEIEKSLYPKEKEDKGIYRDYSNDDWFYISGLGESHYNKAKLAKAHGIPESVYAKEAKLYYEWKDAKKGSGKDGAITQKDTKAIIASMDLPKEQADTLFKIVTGKLKK